jgi:hypothetical protein
LWQGLLDPANTISAREGAPVRTGFFHEDDYCQVEVLPAAAADYCRAEMDRIDQFAEAHRDGAGFTDVYLRGESPVPLAALRITLAEIREAVEPLLPPFDQVFTGYSSFREPCQSTVGWGEGDSRAVFVSVGEGGVVRAVWLSVYGIPPDRFGHWCRALRALPHAAELVVADWNSSEVVPLADESALAAYLGRYHAGSDAAT